MQIAMAAVRSRPSVLVLSYLCCFSTLSVHVRRAASLSFNLNFSEPQSLARIADFISFAGDADPTPDTLELTKNRRDQTITHSTGRAQYAHPVPLWDKATGEMASFTSTFSFRITLDDASSASPGDGMAFFLGHFQAPIPLDSRGGGLALLSAFTNNVTGNGTIVAVEFDTFQNPEYGDISWSHVGIDVNSLNSTAVTDASSPGNNLMSGYPMVATVRYENVSKLLAVNLHINDKSYSVNATVDLRRYLPEYVAVGFSAATGMNSEQHQVTSWSFSSTLEPRRTPTIPPPTPDTTITSKPPPEATGSITSKHPQRASILIPAVLVPLLFLLACSAAVAFLVWRRQHKRETSEDSDCEEQHERAELERGVAASGPKRYTYRELAAATNNFADEKKLGRGGFGSVYRGKLVVCGGQDDRPVAIKMFSSESSAQGRKEFEAEVKIISRLKHRNLVQLLGWCDSRSGLLLVYELLAQGSLDKHLYSSDRILTWYQIILGLGSALRYLHQEWEHCVVHGDIKPSNIMLDESLGTKLGDFGLARLGEHGARWRTTRAVLGTAGYIDPEFVNTRQPSTESDVYSFGIVLLETVSSRPPVVLQLQEGGGPHFILLKWVWGLYGRNAILDAADELLRGDELEGKCMERVLIVGLWCAHPDQSKRPSIAQAMHILQSEDARLPALPPYMYTTVPDFAITGRAYGALSIESGVSSLTTTGASRISSESSATALLRDSKEFA